MKEIFPVFTVRLQSLSGMFWIGFEQSLTTALKKCSDRSSYDNDTAVSTARVDLQKGGNDQKRRGRLNVSTRSRQNSPLLIISRAFLRCYFYSRVAVLMWLLFCNWNLYLDPLLQITLNVFHQLAVWEQHHLLLGICHI